MKTIRTLSCVTVACMLCAPSLAVHAQGRRIESLLQRMTLEEKIGQLTQYSYGMDLTGPAGQPIDQEDEIRKGRVGSLLNATGAAQTRRLQTMAHKESRLGIPLLFGLDVIHGYQTIFPVPLAEAASWDLAAIEQSARIAAIEATAAGVHWTFAPMVDIARDPRWGRIMEGAGEDPYLGSEVARARVRGFQGQDLRREDTLLACAKHFAAYGAAQAGRDYATVDISLRTLHEVHLPPFEAAVDAGVGTFMNAFNELNGIPCTGNPYLVREVLKKQWGFDGFVVSDWDSIKEMITHGFADDAPHASELAIHAGCDMDMMSAAYIAHLADLVRQGSVPMAQIDDAVTRILNVKQRMGLFEDPYLYCDARREKDLLLKDTHQAAARDVARKSIVLLKNENQTLPLDTNVKRIALVGPLADNQVDPMGSWSAKGEDKDIVTLRQGILDAVSSTTEVLYAQGCDIHGEDAQGMAGAVRMAAKADVIIAALGESKNMSGEAHCRGDIGLPGLQLELLKRLQATGKPVVLVLMNGRPLTLVWPSQHVPAILETWLLGTQTGPAIADVLFGKANPSGKLPVTFPHAVGQIPIFYSHKMTGRPGVKGQAYRSTYEDMPVAPLYPFGFGLSYTRFTYSPIQLDREQMTYDGTVQVSTTVTNAGSRQGAEVVQLYVRDVKASVTRPVKELKGFQKINLEPGKSRKVTFALTTEDLAFYNQAMQKVAEPGRFEVFVGGNSRDVLKAEFMLIKR